MRGTILLVEDSKDDIFFVKRAMKMAGIENPLQVVTDGQRAIDYLSGEGEFKDRQTFPLPLLVLLDLNLPKIQGLEVLKWIRQQPALATLLVVILTSSKEDPDIDRGYRRGANSYLVKPPGADKLLDLFKSLGDYWLQRNEPPPIRSA